LLIYWFNIFMAGLILYLSLRYARRNDLLKDDLPLEIRRAMRRRIVFAQGWYALGALLCFIDTYLSIAFIFLVQLNYAIAPRIPKRWRSEADDGPSNG